MQTLPFQNRFKTSPLEIVNKKTRSGKLKDGDVVPILLVMDHPFTELSRWYNVIFLAIIYNIILYVIGQMSRVPNTWPAGDQHKYYLTQFSDDIHTYIGDNNSIYILFMNIGHMLSSLVTYLSIKI